MDLGLEEVGHGWSLTGSAGRKRSRVIPSSPCLGVYLSQYGGPQNLVCIVITWKVC